MRDTVRLCVFLLLLVSLRPARAAEGALIRLDEGSLRPYGVCTGTLSLPGGLSGAVEVRGRLYDGGDLVLFRADLPGWTSELEFVFIPDESVHALFIAGYDSETELPPPPDDGGEADGRRLLGSLAAPFRSGAPLSVPKTARFFARDPGDAGAKAAAHFIQPRNSRVLLALGAYSAIVLALVPLRKRLAGTYLPGLAVLSLAGCLGAAALGAPGPVLYRFSLPNARGPYDLDPTAFAENRRDYTLVSYGLGLPGKAEERPGLSVIGVRASRHRPLPLSAFPPNTRLKFRIPPLVIRAADGSLGLSVEGFALGWALYE